MQVVFLIIYLCIVIYLCIRESKKLDSYVLAAIVGYQSIDGLTKSTVYKEDEVKYNYIKGCKEDISIHLMRHFLQSRWHGFGHIQ